MGDDQCYTKDFCDDGEPGAGRHLLDYLEKNDLKARVIFVARKYGGIRMGPDRFTCYKQAAELAIQENLYNVVLKENQEIKEKAKDIITKPCRRAPEKDKDDKQQHEKDPKRSKHPASSPLENQRPMPQRQPYYPTAESYNNYPAIRGSRTQHTPRYWTPRASPHAWNHRERNYYDSRED